MREMLRNELKRFLREEEGTEVVEWALVAGLIVAVGAGVFVLVGGDLDTIFTVLQNLTGEAADEATAANP